MAGVKDIPQREWRKEKGSWFLYVRREWTFAFAPGEPSASQVPVLKIARRSNGKWFVYEEPSHDEEFWWRGPKDWPKKPMPKEFQTPEEYMNYLDVIARLEGEK